jgi:hypothetical protein
MTKLAEIEAAALRLSDEERFHLTDKLLGTLSPSSAAGEPDDVLGEALRRDAELEANQVKSLTEDEFWAGAGRARR